MKAAIIVAVVMFALAAILYAIDAPPAGRIAPCLVSIGLAALAISQWPGLAA